MPSSAGGSGRTTPPPPHPAGNNARNESTRSQQASFIAPSSQASAREATWLGAREGDPTLYGRGSSAIHPRGSVYLRRTIVNTRHVITTVSPSETRPSTP